MPKQFDIFDRFNVTQPTKNPHRELINYNGRLFTSPDGTRQLVDRSISPKQYAQSYTGRAKGFATDMSVDIDVVAGQHLYKYDVATDSFVYFLIPSGMTTYSLGKVDGSGAFETKEYGLTFVTTKQLNASDLALLTAQPEALVDMVANNKLDSRFSVVKEDCVKMLPMTEDGEYVSDVVGYSEGIVNAEVTNTLTQTTGTGNTITEQGAGEFTIHNESPTTASYQPIMRTINSNFVAGEAYLMEVSFTIVSGSAYAKQIEAGDLNGVSAPRSIRSVFTAGDTYSDIFIGNYQADGTFRFFFDAFTSYDGTVYDTFDATVSIAAKKLTGVHQINNFLTLPDTNVRALNKGLQTSKFQLDSLGRVSGEGRGIEMHGIERPALRVPITDTQLGSKFAIEFVISREQILENRALLYSVSGLDGLVLWTSRGYTTSEVQLYLYNGDGSTPNRNAIIDADYHHIIFENDGSNLTMIVDGVAGTPVAHSFVPSGLNFADSIQLGPKGSLPMFNIYDEATMTKSYNRDKEIVKGAAVVAQYS